ncbi:MAG: cation-translocating P-type ATPase [Chloroflexaceae bacterium]|nr:cation-translocating P-type ATPase [Chloroflexaceae bacterium]
MAAQSQDLTFHIGGMDCADCARAVEQGVQNLPGVQTCQLTFATEKLHITGTVSREAVVQRVQALGYEVREANQPAAPQPTNFWGFLWHRTATRLALLAVVLMVPVLVGELLGIEHLLLDLAALTALVLAGWPVARSAWRALTINRSININVLMTIAAIGAVVIGAYAESAMVMILFAFGEALEGYSASRARDSIRRLMEVMPNTATLLRRATPASETISLAVCSCGDGCCESAAAAPMQVVGIDTLTVGDIILVRPGERIPMDGRVVAGASSVNQAPITGESRLIEKQHGDEVFASSINGEGALEVEVTHRAADNTISRLIRMVAEAQEQRAPTQRFIDRFAQYYTPAVVALALLVASVPPLLFGQPFWNPADGSTGWLYRALALLVVACPCALVISTPVSIISAISNAAHNGVLVKGGAYLEALSRVRAMAFDKTGTLTAGKPAVIEVQSVGCLTGNAAPCHACDNVLALAGSLEQRSEHPLAYAIVSAAAGRGLDTRYPAAQNVTALVGQGITGAVGTHIITLGSHRYFDSTIAHPPEHCHAAQQAASAGYTPVLVSVNGSYIGTITVADTVRPTSHAALHQLKQAGMRALVMLTGDTTSTAHRIGQEVGVTEVRAELLPAAKVQAVHDLKQRYGQVAMVGDGINDAPALAAADVSIAIGGQAGGTAQAMETADITLMRDDLRLLPFAVHLSRATLHTIWVNVALALGLKLFFLVLVLLGSGTLWMAVLADDGAALLVTLYGMRLLRWGHPPA